MQLDHSLSQPQQGKQKCPQKKYAAQGAGELTTKIQLAPKWSGIRN